MKLLITGIHGFVGSNLVAAMGDKFEIYGLDIVYPEKKGVTHTYSWKDLDEGKIPPVDAIIHLAGKVRDTKDQSDANDYFAVNTNLTKKIYDYFLTSTARKFLFFSSVKAVADFVPEGVLTEDFTPSPVGPYGESKLKAEEYINSRPLGEGKQVYILRPSMIHGPGNKGNLKLLYSFVRKGLPWPFGSFDNKRSFTSIENLNFVINSLLTKPIRPGVYNMADDEAVSTQRLIELIGLTLGKNVRIWHIGKKLIENAVKIGDVLRLPSNSERLHKLTENYVVSNAKIKDALGIDNMPVSAEQGLIQSINSFKS
jgi:nucleoside-diphosphate-sugar epimerase